MVWENNEGGTRRIRLAMRKGDQPGQVEEVSAGAQEKDSTPRVVVHRVTL